MNDAALSPADRTSLPPAFRVDDLPSRAAADAAFLIPLLQASCRGSRVLELVSALVATDRWNSFDQFAQTSNTLQRQLAARGLKPECHTVPTGGGTGDGRWRINWASNIISGSIDIVSPVDKRIADYRDNPWEVVQWALSTAPGGEELELRVVDSLEALQTLRPGALAGCAVLTSMHLYHHQQEWVAKGARTVICDAPVKDCPEATAWTKLGWGGTPMGQSAARLPAFALAPPKGRYLRDLCDAYGRVIVKVNLDIRDFCGHHDVVSGVLRGRDDPQDEVWAVAHCSEPGAIDNASGVAACIEALSALQTLIGQGVLPAPRRSIRMLAGFECYGFFHYLETVPRLQTPLAGLVVDCVGAKHDVCHGLIGWHATVPSSASFVNSLGLGLLRRAFALMAPQYDVTSESFVSTDDTMLGDPLYGFPCPYLGSFPYRGYHSSADTVDQLDGPALAATATGVAAYLYCLANAETADALQWGGFASRETLDAWSRPATDKGLTLACHAASMDRLPRFFWGGCRDEALAQLDRCRRELPAVPDDIEEALVPREARVPFRRIPLGPTYENMPVAIRTRIRRSNVHTWALYWADGCRDLREIRALASAERGKAYSAEQISLFFEALEAIGYVVLQRADKVVTRSRLVADLRALGVCAGMDLMVHSSLAALGWVRGGADTVVQALLEAVGPEGTLLMPSFNHQAADVFNPLATPTTNGAIPDAFWRRRGVVRSLHPTHAVAAFGPHAEAWCAQHLEVGIWAAQSPIGRLIHGGGSILGLGVDHTSSTAYHVAEVSMQAPCLDAFGDRRSLVAEDGSVQTVPGLLWRADTCPVSPKLLNAGLDQRCLQRHGKVGEAASVLVKARDLWDLRREHLKNACPTCTVRPVVAR